MSAYHQHFLRFGTCLLLLFGVSCSENKNLPEASLEDEADDDDTGPTRCEPGAERECYEPLGEHNGILSCYDGVQICEAEGGWGPCQAGGIRSVEMPPDAEPWSRRLQAVTGTTTCDGNPCDPSCQLFGDLPDAASTDNLIINTSTIGWVTGSVSRARGLVKKGLNEPCSSGADCQFNMQCINPVSNECTHDKCQPGDALFQGCDPCVESICAESPECCVDETEACEHDLCAEGPPLKDSCDPCVAAICDAFPRCCRQSNGAWDAECVAEVENTCGQSCGCCEGELAHSGSCYYRETEGQTWPEARASCEERGSGWDLISIGDASENAFLYDAIDGEHTWIGLTNGNGLSSGDDWVWSNGDPPGNWDEDDRAGHDYNNFQPWEPGSSDQCARMNSNEDGTWDGRNCEYTYDSFCEGPPSCQGGTVPPPAACEHDPCQIGTELKSNCDVCVQAICNAEPDCCEDAWTEECVELVATECTAQCECSEGEEYFQGHCYALGTSDRNWFEAYDACTNYKSGWNLASIGDSEENNFVYGMLGNNDAWIGFTERDEFISGNNRWVWTNGDPSGSWRESDGNNGDLYTRWGSGEPDNDECARMRHDDNGRWWDLSCWSDYDFVCEGLGGQLSEFTPITIPSSMSVRTALQSSGSSGSSRYWNQSCVDQVKSVCDAQCGVPADQGTGVCVPWYPNQVDESCTGIDLAVGLPCDNSIPVCNHGTQEAPAGIRVVHFPANSQQYPSCEPDQGHPQMYECFTEEPIAPGECINVTSCPHLVGNREIMVNPDGSAHIDECSCLDNWSLYTGGECEPPVCSGGTNVATLSRRPIDIIIAIDNSASMQGEIYQVQERINEDFAQIIQDSGIDYRVIMVSRYGNVHVQNYNGGSAATSAYSICVGAPLSSLVCPVQATDTTPDVAHNEPRFFHHSTDIGSRDLWCKLTGSYNTTDPYPTARTDFDPIAMLGWGAFLREQASKVFIAITDDAPATGSGAGECPTTTGFANTEAGAQAFDQAIRTLAPQHFGAYDSADPNKDRNYTFYSIVGMAGNHSTSPTPLEPNDPIETRCCRGDGTIADPCPNINSAPLSDGVRNGVGYQYLSRITGGLRYPSCYNNNFDDVFNAIAEGVIEGAEVSCDFALQNEGNFDINTAQVSFLVSPDAEPVELTRAATISECGINQWYLPDPSRPSLLSLCPSACAEAQANPNAELSVEVGCLGTGYEPVTFSEIYQGECSFDEVVQWGFFSFETMTPSDSNLVFRVRTAATEDQLGDAEFIELTVVNEENGNAVCNSPDVEGCPIDLFEALAGAPLAHHSFLEVQVEVNPSSDGSQLPSLQGWDLTYSCPDAQ